MDYRKYGSAYYIRCDRNDEIISSILSVCRSERIQSATFNGIGGCASAALQVFDPKTGKFHTRQQTGMLELITLMGNVISNSDGSLDHHTHALFAYEEGGVHKVLAGHLKETVVLYTVELELRPVEGVINHKPDPETGTGFWHFPDK